MSNPFDQFSGDLRGALPVAPPPANDSYSPYPPQANVMSSPPRQTYANYPTQTQVPPSYGAPPPDFGAPPLQQDYGAPPSQPDYGAPTTSYGAPPPAYGAPQPAYGAPPEGNPFGAPPQMAPPQPPPDSNPFGASQLALVPSNQPQQSPYALNSPPPQQPKAYGGAPPMDPGNPFGSPDAGNPFGSPPPMPPGPPTAVNDPWAAPGPPQYQQPAPDPMYGAMVPAAPPVDPFSVFNSAPAPPPAAPPAPLAPPQMDMYGGGFGGPPGPPPPQPQQHQQQQVGGGDLFGDMGFGSPAPSGPPAPTNSDGIFENAIVPTEPGQRKQESDLPPGGEWYDARIFTPTLGVMFFKPQELTDSLFLNTDRETVDMLAERPVVAFIVEGSSARSAGVELGHVLLKVNGVDVKNPKDASRLIKEGPRPLPLLFYVPPTEITVAEGEHMVKYDTRDTLAPNSAKDWKPKYVVIGGIIAQPWMMNMYRSKSEYDIAVIETQARRPVSVKVKQFSLQGARIQNDWQGPQMVKYKNKLHPWKYIVVLPVARNPIKISSPNLTQLKPVHEGIRRVLLAQQRDRGTGSAHTAGPVRENDPYGNSGGNNGRSTAQNLNRPAPQDDGYARAPAPPPAPASAPVVDLLGFDSPAPAQAPPQQQPPSYGAPPPQYGAPPPQYGAPPQQYGAPPAQYGAPPPQYGAPPPQYGAPPTQYAAQPPAQFVQQPYINY